MFHTTFLSTKQIIELWRQISAEISWFSFSRSKIVRRGGHGCATLQLGRKNFGVVAGGYLGNILDSTEWIDLEEDSPTWTEGMQDKSKIVYL